VMAQSSSNVTIENKGAIKRLCSIWNIYWANPSRKILLAD